MFLFLYPLKNNNKKAKVFWYFHGVKNETIGQKLVKLGQGVSIHKIMLGFLGSPLITELFGKKSFFIWQESNLIQWPFIWQITLYQNWKIMLYYSRIQTSASI